MLKIAFSGNRYIDDSQVIPVLEYLSNTFPGSVWRSGMAIGLDMYVAQYAMDNGINFEAHLPFPPDIQTKLWNKALRSKYNKIIESGIETFVYSQSYSAAGYMKRNIKMVEDADMVIVFNRKKNGGTMNTIKYCIKSNITLLDGLNKLERFSL